VLLGQNAFYPFQPAVSQSLQDRLNAETAAAKRAGFPLKVAIIGSAVDLGAIPELFGKPQQYAAFLDREISFLGPQPVLVVMAAGYGVQGVKPAVARALTALPKASGRTPNDLARAATTAVARLAAADGRSLTRSGSGSRPGARRPSSGGGSSRVVLLSILIAAAVVVAMLLLALRSRDLLAQLRAERRGAKRNRQPR
jgi:hypothetical protein